MQKVAKIKKLEGKKRAERIEPDYIMCMLCEYSCYYTDGKIECEYEDEDGEINPNLRKNFDCSRFTFYAPYLVEIFIRIIKEIRGN